MTQDPLRITLDTLRSEREGAERDAVELEQKLKAVGQRLTHLRGAIENIEALLGVPSVDDEAVLNALPEDDQASGATVREVDFTNTADAPSVDSMDGDADTDDEPFAPVVRKRVPSTDWVADVLERMGHPGDRDDIFKAFKHYKGFPKSWTNPRNSVNNALGRAVERGMVLKLEENLFAPLGYKPTGRDISDHGES